MPTIPGTDAMLCDPDDPHDVDAAALARAEAVIANLRGAYLDWVRGDLARLHALLDEARATPPAGRGEQMRQIFTVAHDVKGQGGSFGYDLVTRIGNHLCRYIERPEPWPDARLEAVARHLEAMDRIIGERLEGAGGETGAALWRQIACL
ncbi:hypothetical protein GALL_79920 [mine drainage metagenome]|uniref:HPt domain-containing protein n=1 Tax=mine drainage metagenome TaxID=410659 RepID=A0A1J5T1E3_9ZZZZ